MAININGLFDFNFYPSKNNKFDLEDVEKIRRDIYSKIKVSESNSELFVDHNSLSIRDFNEVFNKK